MRFNGLHGCVPHSWAAVFQRAGRGAPRVKASLITYELALSQAHYTGGFDFGGFGGPGSASSGPNFNNVAFGVDTKDPFVPKFPVLNGVNIYDPAQYQMTFADAEKDSIFERDVVGDISLNK